jgi:hypothetical protein
LASAHTTALGTLTTVPATAISDRNSVRPQIYEACPLIEVAQLGDVRVGEFDLGCAEILFDPFEPARSWNR